MKIGDTVKRSEYSLRPKRDYWLNCGREPMKSGAKDALEKAKAERGTIIDGPARNQHGATVVRVRLDSGSVEDCMVHHWELA